MTLKLEFKDPLLVSRESVDWLIISFANNTMFSSLNGVIISASY